MYVPEPASLLDWKFEELRQLADTSGPKFVFAHLLVPHEPFIYNADCSHREPLWPTTRHDKNDPEARTAYVNQIRCVNAKLLTVTRAIIARSQSPPIVILQADHGNGRLDASLGSADEAGAARVAERVEPFAAYYLPGNPSGVVYDSITPVNVLPRIFNYYFGAGIPLQPDETYWSSALRPFDFTKVR
jgi:hypothetical protein